MAKKKKARKNRAGTFIILIGFLCVLGAGGLTLYNYWEGMQAEKASADVMTKLVDVIGDNLDEQYAEEEALSQAAAADSGTQAGIPETEGTEAADGSVSAAEGGASGKVSTSGKSRTPDGKIRTRKMEDPSKTPYREMPTTVIDGYSYIGFLEIPSLSLSLPVMTDWDYNRLKVSPCRYSGSYYTDDLVICGHNYARHFSPIKWISMGADVYFTNVNGESIHYITSNIETVKPTNIDSMIDNINNGGNGNDWDMTLFTCNTGGQTRCAVRCTRVD